MLPAGWCVRHTELSELNQTALPWREEGEGKRDEEEGWEEEKRAEGKFMRHRKLGDFQG